MKYVLNRSSASNKMIYNHHQIILHSVKSFFFLPCYQIHCFFLKWQPADGAWVFPNCRDKLLLSYGLVVCIIYMRERGAPCQTMQIVWSGVMEICSLHKRHSSLHLYMNILLQCCFMLYTSSVQDTFINMPQFVCVLTVFLSQALANHWSILLFHNCFFS